MKGMILYHQNVTTAQIAQPSHLFKEKKRRINQCFKIKVTELRYKTGGNPQTKQNKPTHRSETVHTKVKRVPREES